MNIVMLNTLKQNEDGSREYVDKELRKDISENFHKSLLYPDGATIYLIYQHLN